MSDISRIILGGETRIIADASARQQLNATAGQPQIANVILNNSQTYPHNNSQTTVAITVPRVNTDYKVHIISTTAAAGDGRIGRIRVFNKLLNGFQLAFTGSAPSVTVRYRLEGGMA